MYKAKRYITQNRESFIRFSALIVVCSLLVALKNVDRRVLGAKKVFISIGTKPSSFELREGIRSTWLTWVKHDADTEYKFFTELSDDPMTNKMLEKENAQNADLVFQEIDGGYANFFYRGIFQIKWALKRYPGMEYYLRVDDDSFLCFQKFKYELYFRPKRNFFWGKYFCKPKKHCADENFMLFSTDVARRVVDGVDKKLFEVRPNNTLARNFGMWSRDWIDLVVFDDRERFDVQQGLLTEYMHEVNVTQRDAKEYAFCEKHMYAHWVKSPTVMRRVYKGTSFNKRISIPKITTNVDNCPAAINRTIVFL